jgi:hypothetical protein
MVARSPLSVGPARSQRRGVDVGIDVKEQRETTMLKSLLALAAAGLVSAGAPATQPAQPAGARTVAIQDLTLVGESGSVAPTAEAERYGGGGGGRRHHYHGGYHYHHGGNHHGGYHHGGYHHGGYHHGGYHHGGYHYHHGGYHHHHGGYHRR